MSTYELLRKTHIVSAALFLLIYMVKTFLISRDKQDTLASFVKIFRIPEMIISLAFFATGIYMITQIPEINTMMIIKIVYVLAAIPVAIVGYKKKNKRLAQLSLLLLILAYGMAEMSKKHISHETREALSAAGNDGAMIYSASCVKCHGADGKARIMGASDLSASAISKENRMLIIEKGKGAMAGFHKNLSPEQISAVSDFLETLKK